MADTIRQEAPRDAGANERPPQRALIVIALAASAVAVGHGFGRLSYPFLLPAMVDDVVGTYARAGLLGMANLGAYLLGILVLITRARHVMLATFLRIGLLGVTAGLVCTALARDYAVLVVGMALMGGFNAAVWVPASAVVASAVSERHRGLAAGALGMGYGLAVVAAGAGTRAVQSTLGDDAWRPVWGLMAAGGAVVLVFVAVALRPLPVSGERGGLHASVLGRLPGAGALTVTYAAFAMGYVVYASYLVAALEDDAGYAPGRAAAMYGLTGITGIVGGLVVGRMSDRLGRRPVLMAGHAAMALCAAVVLLGAQPWVGLSAATFGLLSSGLPAAVAAYIGDHLEASSVAAALGVVTIAFSVSQAVGPPLGGYMADATGHFRFTMGLAAAAHIVGVAAAALLPRRAAALRPRP